ncbi:hypothetical protein L6452_44566 [Arctium lappa]|uniref:Uncharacterized protein n=1 Tax=Arctium lappa TaxID=4217 RepID=A0ACB8XG88_ARCLA|nr:hypothetical protein L6452_44566 [Arctium lappa]
MSMSINGEEDGGGGGLMYRDEDGLHRAINGGSMVREKGVREPEMVIAVGGGALVRRRWRREGEKKGHRRGRYAAGRGAHVAGDVDLRRRKEQDEGRGFLRPVFMKGSREGERGFSDL